MLNISKKVRTIILCGIIATSMMGTSIVSANPGGSSMNQQSNGQPHHDNHDSHSNHGNHGNRPAPPPNHHHDHHNDHHDDHHHHHGGPPPHHHDNDNDNDNNVLSFVAGAVIGAVVEHNT